MSNDPTYPILSCDTCGETVEEHRPHPYLDGLKVCLACQADAWARTDERYKVGLYDCCGERYAITCIGFSAARWVAQRMREEYAAHLSTVLRVYNLDRCEGDSDGLTDEEREAI